MQIALAPGFGSLMHRALLRPCNEIRLLSNGKYNRDDDISSGQSDSRREICQLRLMLFRGTCTFAVARCAHLCATLRVEVVGDVEIMIGLI